MASSESKAFPNSLEQVFSAAQKAVRDLGYKVDSLDKTNGLLNFKTGMSWWSWAGQEMSVMMIDNGDGAVEVSVSGRRNQNGVVLQVTDWGEATGIAKKVLIAIGEHLPAATAAVVDDSEVIRFKCRKCRERLTWAANDAGNTILCTNCGEPNRVPTFDAHPSRAPKPSRPTATNPRLRNCPDCEAQVSKRATQCPHCGCPLDSDE